MSRLPIAAMIDDFLFELASDGTLAIKRLEEHERHKSVELTPAQAIALFRFMQRPDVSERLEHQVSVGE